VPDAAALRVSHAAREPYRRRLQGVSTIGWVVVTLFFCAVAARRKTRAIAA
jgi:hypothetical protein